MGTRILLAASGLRPIDSIALEPIIPIATAGPIAPIAITIAFANTVGFIQFLLTNNNFNFHPNDYSDELNKKFKPSLPLILLPCALRVHAHHDQWIQ